MFGRDVAAAAGAWRLAPGALQPFEIGGELRGKRESPLAILGTVRRLLFYWHFELFLVRCPIRE
jgi:hypothetical protein